MEIVFRWGDILLHLDNYVNRVLFGYGMSIDEVHSLIIDIIMTLVNESNPILMLPYLAYDDEFNDSVKTDLEIYLENTVIVKDIQKIVVSPCTYRYKTIGGICIIYLEVL